MNPKILALLFCTLLTIVFIGSVVSILRGKSKRSCLVLVKLVGLILLVIGVSAFLAPALCTVGILKLPNDFEWPAGSVEILRAENGDRIVLLEAASRIQIYDQNLKFLRGWQLQGEKGLTLQLGNGTNVEIILPLSKRRLLYDLSGALLSQDSYKREDAVKHESPKISAELPTPWWGWIFTSPAHAWLLAACGGAILFASDWQKRRLFQQRDQAAPKI